MTSNSICLAFRAGSYFSTKKNSRREISAGRTSWRSARKMTQLVRALPPNTLDDDAWDDLLSFIEERRVIPIVGPELLQVATPSGPKLLYDWLAERLPAKLSVDVTEPPQTSPPDDVVCLFLATRGRREEAYVRLRSILRDANLEPSASLRRLAAITDFDLFVS